LGEEAFVTFYLHLEISKKFSLSLIPKMTYLSNHSPKGFLPLKPEKEKMAQNKEIIFLSKAIVLDTFS
jgi:hypothetical protein